MSTNTNQTTEGTLVVDRVFDAPLDRVWKAWTDPEEGGKTSFTLEHVGGPRPDASDVCEELERIL